MPVHGGRVSPSRPRDRRAHPGRNLEIPGSDMNYTVTWQPRAQARLAQLWTNGPDRAAVSAAANRIDALLRQNPSSRGESRSDGTRILFVPPLAVQFRVSELDCCVDV